MYKSATDTIGFTCGGTSIITINSSGISGNGSGLTNINYNNLLNKPASGLQNGALITTTGTSWGVSFTGTLLKISSTIGCVYFTHSGTINFPADAICEILIVAGGGGGEYSLGGGGAGG